MNLVKSGNLKELSNLERVTLAEGGVRPITGDEYELLCRNSPHWELQISSFFISSLVHCFSSCKQSVTRKEAHCGYNIDSLSKNS